MNLREKIINEFGGLSPELQRAAEFSLQNASQLVVLSMRAFAAEAGVKPATLLRLAQRLGYRGWSELKSDFIDDLGLRNDTYVSKAEKMMARGTQTQLYKEVFQAHQANLTFTQNENAQEMEQAVTLLDSAENVYICGFRASFPIAWSLFYVFPSVVSGMGLAECLLAMLVVRHGREAVSKIESAERYLIDSGVYVIPGKS